MSDKEMDGYIRISKEKIYRDDTIYWNGLANERLADFNKQLLTVALVVLPLSASILGVGSLLLREFQKTLLVISWVLLGASVISGLIQTITDAKYLRGLSEDSNKRESVWSEIRGSIDVMDSKTKGIPPTEPSSTHLPLVLQTCSAFLALAAIMVVAATVIVSR